MSILIKDMEMPRGCDECYIREKDTCPLLKVNVGEWGRLVGCPLVELPDHGDLIDRDEAADDACLIWGRNSSGDDAVQEIIEHLRKMKAVIPAERSEE